MTLNAEFLWDGVAPEEGEVKFERRNDRNKAAEHMRLIADLIAKANADVVNLCEVENLQALTMLNDRYLAGMGYRVFFVQGTDTHTGQDMGLLTRLDPVGDRIQRDERKGTSGVVQKGVSKHYIARFEAGRSKIAMIGAHLLAFPRDKNRKSEREAQADALRQMAVDLSQDGYHIIVLGDLNDFDGSPDSLDRSDSKPITRVLTWIRGMDPKSKSDDLRNALAMVPKERRYTCFYDRNSNGRVDEDTEFDAIDHVLLSPFLYESIEKVEILHGHDPMKVTDHFPIVVTIQWPPKPPTD